MEETHPKRVGLRVEVPPGVRVLRQEILDRVPDWRVSKFESHGSIATGGDFESRVVGQNFAERLIERSITLVRKQGQAIAIGDCRVTVIKISHGNALLGVEAPASIPIIRGEIESDAGLPSKAGPRNTSRPVVAFPRGYVSVDELLEEVGRLGPTDLRRFFTSALELRAKREAPLASERESDLLLRINEGLPVGLSRRLEELEVKRDAEVLTDDEHGELIRLSDEVEQRETERVKLLEELAALRQLTLPVLMRSMGLTVPVHG